MKLPFPRDQGYNGSYLGIGSKPAPRAWTPGGRRAAEKHERVPREFRGLELRRGTRSKVDRAPIEVPILLGFVVWLFVHTLILTITS